MFGYGRDSRLEAKVLQWMATIDHLVQTNPGQYTDPIGKELDSRARAHYENIAREMEYELRKRKVVP